MIIKDIPTLVFKTNFYGHKDKKESILNAISSIGKCSVKTEEYNLSHTDWHLSDKWKRPYWPLVENEINSHIEKIAVLFDIRSCVVHNYWVQQYEDNDFHGWHTHGNCMFASVYYLELPNSNQTNFKFIGQEFTVDCAEGDIITFPSYLSHCSKPNKSGSRKTVIAFNFSFLES